MISREEIYKLLTSYRESVHKMEFYKVPERIKMDILSIVSENTYKSTPKDKYIKEPPKSLEIKEFSVRPSILKGVTKTSSHKNKGKYTSTDYYIVDGVLYIFVRSKDKEQPNLWIEYKIVDFDIKQWYDYFGKQFVKDYLSDIKGVINGL